MFIYKYMSFEKFIDMVELERLYLTHTVLWDDVYEGESLLKVSEQTIPKEVRDALSGPISQFDKFYQLAGNYAQSWTIDNDESDAMWRIYSNQKKGVRIKVDCDDVFFYITKDIKKIDGDMKIIQFPITYEAANCASYIRCIDKERNGWFVDSPQAFKYKRIAFKHEKEYRFFTSLPAKMTLDKFTDMTGNDLRRNIIDSFNNVIYYSFPLNLLKEVLLDPRASKEHEELFMKYCENRMFKNNGVVFKKSMLYTL